MNNIYRNIALATILIMMSGVSLMGQFQDANDVPKTNSPFTSFGLGNLSPQGTGTVESYGGLYAAFQDPFAINLVNPASLTSLSMMAFETGAHVQTSRFTQNETEENTLTGNLDYITMAFPTKNLSNEAFQIKPSTFKHAMSISLAPYSVVGYDIVNGGGSVNGQDISDTFRGKGGTYKFTWGNAVKYKNLSFGVNIGYLFGNIEQERALSLVDSELSFATIDYRKINIRGSQWNVGLQYNILLDTKAPVKEGQVPVKNQIILGVYGNGNSDLTSITDNIVSRGIPRLGQYVALDTIQNVSEQRATGRMPAEFGFGAIYYKTDRSTNFAKFKGGFNFSTTSWSNFVLEGRDENLGDGWTLGIGAQWLPDDRSLKYRKRIRYRFGFILAQDPRIIQSNQLKRTALQLGMGLPLKLQGRGNVSLINLSLELGRINSNSIDETYGRLGVGFTLNDNKWFLKRKLN